MACFMYWQQKTFYGFAFNFTAALTEVYWPTNIARHIQKQEGKQNGKM